MLKSTKNLAEDSHKMNWLQLVNNSDERANTHCYANVKYNMTESTATVITAGNCQALQLSHQTDSVISSLFCNWHIFGMCEGGGKEGVAASLLVNAATWVVNARVKQKQRLHKTDPQMYRHLEGKTTQHLCLKVG